MYYSSSQWDEDKILHVKVYYPWTKTFSGCIKAKIKVTFTSTLFLLLCSDCLKLWDDGHGGVFLDVGEWGWIGISPIRSCEWGSAHICVRLRSIEGLFRQRTGWMKKKCCPLLAFFYCEPLTRNQRSWMCYVQIKREGSRFREGGWSAGIQGRVMFTHSAANFTWHQLSERTLLHDLNCTKRKKEEGRPSPCGSNLL